MTFNREVVEQAKALATKVHEGQKRDYSGEPYITHPAAVAENFPDNYLLQAVSWLHDAEDADDLAAVMVKIRAIDPTVAWGVDVMTRREDETYLEYILRIKSTEMFIPVKLADLRHNMSTCKKGSRLDKYRMAEYILTHD